MQPLPQFPASVARAIDLIVLHCSATPSGKPIGPWDAATTIDAWHRQRGFHRSSPIAQKFNPALTAIGYHFVVDLDGKVYTGRSLEEIGAHVEGFNARSVGICLVGGAEREARYTAAQWASAAQLVLQLAQLLKVQVAEHRLERSKGVCGHRDLSPDLNGDGVIKSNEWLKTCPGFDVGAWIGRGFVPLAEQIVQTNGAGHA